MQQQNPWILFMGGIALLQVSMLVYGLHAARWVRYVGAGLCVAMGITAIVLGLRRYAEKKHERPKFVSRHQRKDDPR